MLRVHLWKEVREQRLIVSLTIGCMLLLAVAYGLGAPTEYVPSDAASWFVVLGLATGLVAISGDLVPGETRRAQLGFLQRTPGALGAAWAAKLITMFAGLSLLGVVGFVCGELCVMLSQSVAAKRLEYFDSFGPRATVILWIGIVVALAAPWVLAVSCWTPRASSVLPTSVLIASVAFSPTIFVVANYDVSLDRTTTICGAVSLLVGGLLATRISFVRGLRFGSRWSASLRGLPVLALSALPCWIWAADRAWTFHHADTDVQHLQITTAVVNTSQTKAYINLRREWSRDLYYAVQLDLPSGETRQVGGVQSHFTTISALRSRFSNWRTKPAELLLQAKFDVTGDNLQTLTMLDARNGTVLGTCDDWTAPQELQGALNDAESRTQRFHLPDRKVAWTERGHIIFEHPDGTRTSATPWPNGNPRGIVVGHGILLPTESGDLGRNVFDMHRQRTVCAPTGWRVRYVRSSNWVMRPDPPRSGFQRRIDLFDPDTGELSYVQLAEGERIGGMVADERLLILANGTVKLFDPDSGKRESVTIEGAHGDRIRAIQAFYPVTNPVDVVGITFERDQSREDSLARLVGNRLVCSARAKSPKLVALFDNDEFIVIRDNQDLERWRFGKHEFEVLFSVGGE